MDVWQRSMDLVSEIYKVTKNYPKEELFGLTNQLRRAVVSITSNIAEGSARRSKIERKRFYEIARASMVEVDSQLEISIKLDYINELDALVNHNFALLTNLILKS
ncbi:MAG: four helix bundle protein [Ignavibacteriaceae bacterium]|nr:four helix bundle protein [Ignavibacteriaceae bacterium]